MFEKLFKRKEKVRLKKCKKCGCEVNAAENRELICPECGAYLRMNPSERVALICDKFEEIDSELKSDNVLNFPNYEDKLKAAQEASGANDAVSYGIAETGGVKYVLFVMNSEFMMGSMGRVVGEKITRAFELALKEKLPLIGFTTSGGARMQEGIFSLMQMAKVSGAVKRHKDAGLLYITVLTDPTTGGVTACSRRLCGRQSYRADHGSETAAGISACGIFARPRLCGCNCAARRTEK